MKPVLKNVDSQPSWLVQSSTVKLAITVLGGHMAPVVFFRDQPRPVQPYYLNPWRNENLKIDDPVLVPLRGDFFCMPFGANAAPYRNEKYDCHGETATRKWSFGSLDKSGGATVLELKMRTGARPGSVTKRLTLVDGQNVVYSSDLLEGYSGRMCMAHHATLDPLGGENSMLLSTSPILGGMTNPGSDEHSSGGEYYALKPAALFKSIEKVPTVWSDKPYDDCSRFPRRRGFVDILQLYNRPAAGPAWTCAVYPGQGFLWFALKDPSVLPTTLFWMENYGRHQAPWKGRNCCLGLEDVCGYFANGLADSARPNAVNDLGLPTTQLLSPAKPFAVNYIQGVARIPKGFNRVVKIKFSTDGLRFEAANGKTAAAAVKTDFIYSGEI